jgi:hypothetical protein
MSTVNLDAGDAAELAELLRFLHDWPASDPDQVDASLCRFVGNRAYDTGQLRNDLNRFAFLLGGDDGDLLFAPGTQ